MMLLCAVKNYWAKDLIFLSTSHEGIGVQAWIDQYLGLQSSGKRKGWPKKEGWKKKKGREITYQVGKKKKYS